MKTTFRSIGELAGTVMQRVRDMQASAGAQAEGVGDRPAQGGKTDRSPTRALEAPPRIGEGKGPSREGPAKCFGDKQETRNAEALHPRARHCAQVKRQGLSPRYRAPDTALPRHLRTSNHQSAPHQTKSAAAMTTKPAMISPS